MERVKVLCCGQIGRRIDVGVDVSMDLKLFAKNGSDKNFRVLSWKQFDTRILRLILVIIVPINRDPVVGYRVTTYLRILHAKSTRHSEVSRVLTSVEILNFRQQIQGYMYTITVV